jgi:hypothetical protein
MNILTLAICEDNSRQIQLEVTPLCEFIKERKREGEVEREKEQGRDKIKLFYHIFTPSSCGYHSIIGYFDCKPYNIYSYSCFVFDITSQTNTISFM